MSEVSLSSIVRRSQNQVSADLGDGYVVMGLRRGDYVGLDAVAGYIWEQLGEPIGVEAVCSAVESEYEVPPDTCRADVLEFLGKMIAEGLVDVVESPSVP
jgi:hypothetical protein